ncbi:MAG: Fe-S protein assembly co-chaperone HscB [Acidobacteria bacterium]|nr:MAG: Fe-S protein assembly co-chaperone HscB [Acidobacteriota bacterium]PYR49435.1 MAG: Fe-S protein assembly co-chaperone HscB [Acidobacteriota bacterium]
MTSDTPVHTIQVCRTCGGGAPVDAHFCPQCTKILSLGRQGDYFAFLGVPRRLQLDPAVLDERFRALSRQFHPDYFYNATPAERRASLERSSYLNDAYRTLKQPISRMAYLLEIEGVWTPADKAEGGGSKQVPPALLEEVFALNEELDELRELRAGGARADQWQARLHRARQPIDAKRAAHEAELEELFRRWDGLAEGGGTEAARHEVLAALRERLLERNYINNLLAGIEKELERPAGVER